MIVFSVSQQNSSPAASSWSMMSQYLSAMPLSVFWSQQPKCSYCVQNSRCHWGLKGGSKSRHWGWADAERRRTSSISGATGEKSGRLFLHELGTSPARKSAKTAPFGWSAAPCILLTLPTEPHVPTFGSCMKLCVRCDAWGCTCYACTDVYVSVVSGMQTISAPTPRLSHIQLPTIEDKLVVDKRPDSVIGSSAAVFCTATQLAGAEALLSKKFPSACPQLDKLSRHANMNSQPQDRL